MSRRKLGLVVRKYYSRQKRTCITPDLGEFIISWPLSTLKLKREYLVSENSLDTSSSELVVSWSRSTLKLQEECSTQLETCLDTGSSGLIVSWPLSTFEFKNESFESENPMDTGSSGLIVSWPLSILKLEECSEFENSGSSGLIVSWPQSAMALEPKESANQYRRLILQFPLSAFCSSACTDNTSLYGRLTRYAGLPNEWNLSLLKPPSSKSHYIAISKLQISQDSCHAAHTFMLTVAPGGSWSLCVGNKQLEVNKCTLLRNFSSKVSSITDVVNIVRCLESSKFCVGNPDSKFTALSDHHGGIFKDSSGAKIVAYFDKECLPMPTIRHSDCEIVLPCDASAKNRCQSCDYFRLSLHSSASREKAHPSCSDTAPSANTNHRFLSTPEKLKRLQDMSHKAKCTKLVISRLKAKLADATAQHGITLDEELTSDFHRVMVEEEEKVTQKWPEGSFKAMFWQQQKEAAEKSKHGMRWHPLMVRWCIYLRHQSSKAYDTLRDSGCIHLPSQRTLRDYTNCVTASSGFSSDVDRQLMQALSLGNCEPWQKLVVLLLDEMYIREGLVFNKHTGSLVGFVDLGEINNLLLDFERAMSGSDGGNKPIAKSMLTIMVRGVFTPHRYAYAQFPTANLSGDLLFQPFWSCVYRLERMGLKNDGHYISWEHLVHLYEQDKGRGSGLALVPKLKFEHVYNLSSFSKMRVDLAAQVLSETVSNALMLTGGEEATETAKFVALFDKFFDLLNVSNFTTGTHKRKDFLHPYRHINDFRLAWLEETFLPYLEKWECSVERMLTHLSKSEQQRMLLSAETRLGLKMTAKSFVGFTKQLFSMDEVKGKKLAFLSANLNQDPLENFFGCQRQRGGSSDNPNVSEFFQNTQALRVVNSFCRAPVRGNCRGGKTDEEMDESACMPIPKRRKVKM